MGFWGKRPVRTDIPSTGVGEGPGYASPPLGSPSWSQHEPGVIDQTPDVTIEQQRSELRHWRLTDDRTGDISQAERIERSRAEEGYDYNGSGVIASVADWQPKVRDVTYENPSSFPNPRRVHTPSNVRFRRTYGQVFNERFLNGNHFSMADHYRTYEIFGMNPAHPEKRNTYRLEPPPRDAFTEDRGPSTPYSPPYAVSHDPSASGTSALGTSYRLG